MWCRRQCPRFWVGVLTVSLPRPVTQGWLDAIVGEVAKDVQQSAGGGVFVARGRGRCRC